MANAPRGWHRDPEDPSFWRWWDGERWTDRRVPIQPQKPMLARRGWIQAASIAVGLIIATFAVGLPRALLLLGIFGVVVAILALTGRPVRGLRSTITKAAALAVGVSLVLVGGVAAAVTARLDHPVANVESSAAPRSLDGEATGRRATPSSPPAPLVTTEDEVSTEPVPFSRSTQDDPSRDVGTSAVVVAGVDGVRTTTTRVTYQDGIEVSRTIISDEITTQPVAEVTAVGSRQPPPPPAAPSGCDPNYSGACVPIASDVDCAGGSGNGPAYVRGPVRIVGADIYDLDRDGDGIACDR